MGIHLRAKTFPFSTVRVVAPRVSIDRGIPLKAKWGQNTIELPPGRHTITCWYKLIVFMAGKIALVGEP